MFTVFLIGATISVGGLTTEFIAVLLRVTGRIRSRQMIELISIGGTLFFVGVVVASYAAAYFEYN